MSLSVSTPPSPDLALNGFPAPHGALVAGSGGVALTGSRAYYARFVPTRNLAVSKIAFATSVAAGANDNVDVGIYNAAGERIVSSGATAGKLNASAGVQTVSITETALTAGTVYYAALACGALGGTAATVIMTAAGAGSGDLFGTAVGTVITGVQNSAATLPATAVIASGHLVPLLAVRSS